MRLSSAVVLFLAIGSAIIAHLQSVKKNRNKENVNVWVFGAIFFWVLYAFMQLFSAIGSDYD